MWSKSHPSGIAMFIRRATEEDLPELARIHKLAYSSAHFTALLPYDVLVSYYRYFLGDEAEIVVVASRCAVVEKIGAEKIEGFAVFGENIPACIAAFKRDYSRQILMASLRHPLAAARKVLGWFAAILSRSHGVRQPAVFLLLSIAVSAPRKGVGARLLAELKARARSRGHRLVGLYVNTGDVEAINAYFRAGFLIKTCISQQYYMECTVDIG